MDCVQLIELEKLTLQTILDQFPGNQQLLLKNEIHPGHQPPSTLIVVSLKILYPTRDEQHFKRIIVREVSANGEDDEKICVTLFKSYAEGVDRFLSNHSPSQKCWIVFRSAEREKKIRRNGWSLFNLFLGHNDVDSPMILFKEKSSLSNETKTSPAPTATVSHQIRTCKKTDFSRLSSCVNEGKYNVLAVVYMLIKSGETKYGNLHRMISIVDDSSPLEGDILKDTVLQIFSPKSPAAEEVCNQISPGCIIRLRDMKMDPFKGVLRGKVFDLSQVVIFPGDSDVDIVPYTVCTSYVLTSIEAEKVRALKEWAKEHVQKSLENMDIAQPSTSGVGDSGNKRLDPLLSVLPISEIQGELSVFDLECQVIEKRYSQTNDDELLILRVQDGNKTAVSFISWNLENLTQEIENDTQNCEAENAKSVDIVIKNPTIASHINANDCVRLLKVSCFPVKLSESLTAFKLIMKDDCSNIYKMSNSSADAKELKRAISKNDEADLDSIDSVYDKAIGYLKDTNSLSCPSKSPSKSKNRINSQPLSPTTSKVRKVSNSPVKVPLPPHSLNTLGQHCEHAAQQPQHSTQFPRKEELPKSSDCRKNHSPEPVRNCNVLIDHKPCRLTQPPKPLTPRQGQSSSPICGRQDQHPKSDFEKQSSFNGRSHHLSKPQQSLSEFVVRGENQPQNMKEKNLDPSPEAGGSDKCGTDRKPKTTASHKEDKSADLSLSCRNHTTLSNTASESSKRWPYESDSFDSFIKRVPSTLEPTSRVCVSGNEVNSHLSKVIKNNGPFSNDIQNLDSTLKKMESLQSNPTPRMKKASEDPCVSALSSSRSSDLVQSPYKKLQKSEQASTRSLPNAVKRKAQRETVFTPLISCKEDGRKYNVFAVVYILIEFNNLRAGNIHKKFSIVDPSSPVEDGEIKDTVLQITTEKNLEAMEICDEIIPGCVIRLHDVKMENFDGVLLGKVFDVNQVVVFPRDSHVDMILPYSVCTSYVLTSNEAQKVKSLREWAKKNLQQKPQNMDVTQPSTCAIEDSARGRKDPLESVLSISQIEGEQSVFDLECQVIEKHNAQTDNGKLLILRVKDGTTTSVCFMTWNLKELTEELQSGTTGYILANAKSVDVVILDPNIASCVKPNDFVCLNNVSCMPVETNEVDGDIYGLIMKEAHSNIYQIHNSSIKAKELERAISKSDEVNPNNNNLAFDKAIGCLNDSNSPLYLSQSPSKRKSCINSQPLGVTTSKVRRLSNSPVKSRLLPVTPQQSTQLPRPENLPKVLPDIGDDKQHQPSSHDKDEGSGDISVPRQCEPIHNNDTIDPQISPFEPALHPPVSSTQSAEVLSTRSTTKKSHHTSHLSSVDSIILGSSDSSSCVETSPEEGNQSRDVYVTDLQDSSDHEVNSHLCKVKKNKDVCHSSNERLKSLPSALTERLERTSEDPPTLVLPPVSIQSHSGDNSEGTSSSLRKKIVEYGEEDSPESIPAKRPPRLTTDLKGEGVYSDIYNLKCSGEDAKSYRVLAKVYLAGCLSSHPFSAREHTTDLDHLDIICGFCKSCKTDFRTWQLREHYTSTDFSTDMLPCYLCSKNSKKTLPCSSRTDKHKAVAKVKASDNREEEWNIVPYIDLWFLLEDPDDSSRILAFVSGDDAVTLFGVEPTFKWLREKENSENVIKKSLSVLLQQTLWFGVQKCHNEAGNVYYKITNTKLIILNS